MRRFLLLALLAFLTACATVPRKTASQQLAEAIEAHWQHQLESDVATRGDLGLPIERLPDVSYAAEQRDATFARELLARLATIDATGLSEDEQISLRILEHLQRQQLELTEHFWLRFQVTPYASPIRVVQATLNALPVADRERLADEYARFLDGFTEVAAEQQRRGILIPKRELPAVRAFLANATLAGVQS